MDITQRPMPGSFIDEDLAGLYHNPFETLQVLQDEWRDKDHASPWSADNMSDIDLGDIDWHKYEPPGVLRKAPNFTSLILQDIITASIDNVKARVVQEDHQKQLEDERHQAAEEEARKNGKSPEPYLPIIIPPEKPIEPDASPTTILNGANLACFSTVSVTSAGKATEVTVVKDAGRRRFAIRRLFHRTLEMGESSAMGGAREALRQKLEARLSKVDIANTDSKTQEALMALRKSGFIQDAELPKPPEPEVSVKLFCYVSAKGRRVQCHSYCKDCFVRLVTAATQNEQQWPPKCCLNQIPFRLVLKHVPDNLKKTFQERASEWELPMGERVYCSQPECGVWIRPKNIKLNKRQGKCERGHLTCTICRGPSHGNEDCPQDYDMNLTNTLAEEEGWKRCFNCHALVEHREACQHMTCRCGTEFCYVCGLRWKTCRCTMQQLRDLKEAADARREKRRLKEQAEAEELRAILAQIEELEREEAARAELERLEQARLEEERWQQQIKERIRLESIRRKEVESKFRQLRLRLNDLHELQQAMLESYQEDCAAMLLHEADAMKLNLSAHHEMQRIELLQKISQKMSTRENNFKSEYAARLAHERKLEQTYLEQLQDFWSGKANAEAEIEQSMIPLRRKMDKGHEAWQRWRDQQIGVYKAKLEDEQIMKEEVMYSQSERMKDMCDEREMQLTRKMVAEKKWFREVVFERERLLGDWEVSEMEGDADSLFMREGEREKEPEPENLIS
ncbi:IBR domain-containing protein [Metarhizium acridum CQMa 102]|uniref:RBR-type E3 ubiquitin transferase n=1 Tax=Metarhizium acridum (strain CQMa 102) TaxID=655827 RepID=E9DSG2_METAQ|nr:IBR domain-containing protein [Metarhizium acridum CQMa 102]EFY93322.1 IBR domain-containing protein [Metarhizium acridum CQMa 102]